MPIFLVIRFLWYYIYDPPCGQGLEYTHRILACRMRRLKGCPDGSASTAWNYDSLLCNRMPTQNAANILIPLVPNPYSTPFTHGTTYCWLGCTIPLYSAFSSSSPDILPYSPFTYPFSFSSLRAGELKEIIMHNLFNEKQCLCRKFLNKQVQDKISDKDRIIIRSLSRIFGLYIVKAVKPIQFSDGWNNRNRNRG